MLRLNDNETEIIDKTTQRDAEDLSNWLPVTNFCKNYHHTFQQIKGKIYNPRSGFIEGYHWCRSTDGRLYINKERFHQWMKGGIK